MADARPGSAASVGSPPRKATPGGGRTSAATASRGSVFGKASFGSEDVRAREVMAGRRGGGEGALSHAEDRGAFSAQVGKARGGPRVPTALGLDGPEGAPKAKSGPNGAAFNPSVQEEREDDVRMKLAEGTEVDAMVSTYHGLLGKLRNVHTLGVYACDFARDGRHLASCSHDGSVVVWDIQKLTARRRYVGHSGPVMAVKFIPSGTNERLATACVDGTVKLWDKRKAICLFNFDGQFSQAVRSLAWSDDGKFLAAGSEDGLVLVWDAENAEKCAGDLTITMDGITSFRLVPQPHFTQGHLGAVRALGFTNDGKHIVSGGDDGILRLWRIDAGGERIRRKFPGHIGAIQALSLNTDSSLCATSGSDGTVRVWVLRTGSCMHVLAGHVGPAYSVTFTHERGGRRIISGGHDTNIIIWDARSGTIIQKMEMTHRSYILGLAARSDGLLFASASGDRTVGLWRAMPPSMLEQLLTFAENTVLFFASLPSLASQCCSKLSSCTCFGSGDARAGYGDDESDDGRGAGGTPAKPRQPVAIRGSAKVRPQGV